MATVNEKGSVIVFCPQCDGGSKSTYEWKMEGRELGAMRSSFGMGAHSVPIVREYRLYRCAGCGRGGFGIFRMKGEYNFPSQVNELEAFFPDATQRLDIPVDTPPGILAEFREAESCMDAKCYRAAAALFRSVLDKTMRANGYHVNGDNLKKQIDAAAADNVITNARKARAHEDIRTLGNDVLHDAWVKIEETDVIPAHKYAQRILEDFYNDRPLVLAQLKAAGRMADEAKAVAS